MAQSTGEKRDLVLAPGEYAFLQDETRGHIKVHVGPTVSTSSAQDRPVQYDPVKKTFSRCDLEQAVQKCPFASEGDYVVLENPSQDGKFPIEGASGTTPTLKIGRKINIPGPCTFGLWPMQTATVLKGHHLRSNQYLLVRIYNEEEAKQNWNQGVAVVADPDKSTTLDANKLTIGKLLIIKGIEISFYIPPTGVEVVPEENNGYVREAVTLERLEYCILIDEGGNRRYERGPQVVFPSPTEQFYIQNEVRKFQAIELNGIQGIHVKVVAEYKEDNQEYKVGQELFITGDESAIYFPRVEHSIIRYGDKEKHYATAVPAGEGRYVMDRDTGEINTEKGPQMLLPDPRGKVIVRRMLSDKQCQLWYPNNEEVLSYNRSLREIANESPSNRSGFVSEGDIEKTASSPTKRVAFSASMRSAFPASYSNISRLQDSPQELAVAETFERSTTYTPPRTITLDTKFDGVPAVAVWIGYAVMIVSKTGNRRVVVGPQTILLNYDESLEVLELSTGKPKTTDKLEKTVYLRTMNNKISDIVEIITSDKVQVELKLSYRVNFEGEDPNSWFQVENYVKYLCDHIRSMLKGMGQKKKIEELDSNGVDIIRDLLLGKPTEGSKRLGMVFSENGMHMTEVEVLGINIKDAEISKLLNGAQHKVVTQNIDLHQAQKELEITVCKEEIQREKDKASWETAKAKASIDMDKLESTKTINLARIDVEKQNAVQQKEAEDAKESVSDLSHSRALARTKATAEQEIGVLTAKSQVSIAQEKAITDNICARFASAQPGFIESIAMLSNKETLVKVAEAMSVQHLIGGNNLSDVIIKVFQGTGLENLIKNVDERASLPAGVSRK